ncbi:MAG: DUF3239 domain-containing protein [Desulfatibacillum sp.]|nr:DUF3239 domain-containing protein [Desulfatibacillum sp.]
MQSMDDQKQCMVSKVVLANGFQIRHFLRAAPEEGVLSGWVFLFGNEDANYSGNIENYVTVGLRTIVEHNPGVVHYLDYPDGAEFIVDESTGQVIPLHEEPEDMPKQAPEIPSPVQEPLLRARDADEQKEESSPDFQPRRPKMPKVRINPMVWIKHYPLWPAVIALCWVPPVLITVFYSFLMGALLLAGCLVTKLLYWNSVYARFRNAKAAPAMVISATPPLIAVAMNLAKDQGKYPAIRVAKYPAKQIENQSLKKGMRLATVAKPAGKNDDQPHWRDFSFVPVPCATNDKIAISRVLHSFSERQWAELELRISQIPTPYKEGLYTVSGKGANWQNS